MASRRLFATVVTVLLAILAIFYQQIPDIFSPAHSVKAVDTARKITYLGSRSPAGIEHFQNIFYAEEPTGQRRFAAPVPTNPARGSVIDATRVGAWCPQKQAIENCLSLMIARPAELRKDAKLPVVAWIHGGGDALGSASDILYEPDGLVKLAAAEGLPLVYVGINYWLGLTVIGQSVGASDIGLHMTAIGGERDLPFQRAVMMSGGPGLNFNSQPDFVERHTSAIADQVGCSARTARPPFREEYFYPTIDGDFIRERPSQSTCAGKLTKGIPLIASWVTNDGAWDASLSTVTGTQVLESFGQWLPNLSAPTKEKLLQLYPVEDFSHMIRPEHSGHISAQYYRAAQLNRDIWFTCPALDFRWQYVRHNRGGGAAAASQVRLYEFNETRYTPVFASMGVSMLGVAHLSDIPYLFNNDHLGAGADNSDAQLALARNFSRSIVQFVHGAAADDGLGFWPAAFCSDHDAISLSARDTPGDISVQVFGGPYGSVPVRCAAKGAEKKALDWERLFSRCAFINGGQFIEEAGV
ncbi:Alpha/Beta hydrolase protein [Aspergillus pseudoustus]|uniref:Alpha/Beta hydrolase protein n=1 Tax=Aspergillus pseudoustus TaxID=1810923 RepID=A0ABR4JWC5_9EURO